MLYLLGWAFMTKKSFHSLSVPMMVDLHMLWKPSFTFVSLSRMNHPWLCARHPQQLNGYSSNGLVTPLCKLGDECCPLHGYKPAVSIDNSISLKDHFTYPLHTRGHGFMRQSTVYNCSYRMHNYSYATTELTVQKQGSLLGHSVSRSLESVQSPQPQQVT